MSADLREQPTLKRARLEIYGVVQGRELEVTALEPIAHRSII